ncbi:MAG: hypothetical protein JXL67_10985 [Calditrichaeota bacterium]|nr:hypothetical protein [Calditrichota bacterium]
MKPSGLADSPLFPRKIEEKAKFEISPSKITERKHATMTPRYHDSMIATIARSVREVGKEVSTYRLTVQEKETLAEIIYYFRRGKCRLSENEIARIAINILIEDFKTDKKSCMLSRIAEVMKA